MEKEEFEKELTQMTKPEVSQLKHQEMLAKAIAKSKDKTVLSLWWLIIPLYIILALLMKSLYMPDATLSSGIHDLTIKHRFVAYVVFLISPLVLILINAISVRKVYILSGKPKSISLLKTIWLNVLIIIFSILILIVYLI
jgi:hypothetical protein